MAKALYGTVAPPSQFRLLDEIRALRTRVAELEAALADAHETANDQHLEQRPDITVVVDDERATVGA